MVPVLLFSSLSVRGETITLAVLAKRGPEATIRRWQPLVNYLNLLSSYTIELKPLSFEELKEAVKRNEVDLVLANPAMYVEFEACCGLSPIVTMKNLKFGKTYTRFGGVIFTRADRKDLNGLKDLQSETNPPLQTVRVGAVNPDSFGGWLMQWREFRRAGLKRGRDFKVRFYGTHDAVVFAVLYGEVDVGCVRTDTLETMAEEGKIRLEDFKVLHPQRHPGFDLLVSTELYPEWPLARAPRLPDEVAEALASVLLALPRSSEVARRAGAAWTIPHNYQPVHECLRELGVGPYAELHAQFLKEARRKYLKIVVGLALAALLAAFVAFYILSLHRRLSRAYQDLEKHRNHLEQLVRARTAYLETLTQRLRDERERLAVILRSLADAVIVTDTQARITLLNPAAERLLEIRAEEAYGKSFCELVPLEMKDEKTCGSEVSLTLQDQQVIFSEAFLRLPSGKNLLVEGAATPIRGEGGEVLGSVIVLRDITLRKRLEEEARKSSKLEALSVMASGLAHDFNNLLATILGYLDVIRLKSKNPEIEGVIEKAQRACLTARTLTRELLTYTSGGGPVKRPLNVKEVLKEAIEFALAGSGVKAEVETDPALWAVEGDPDQIAVCLHNLLLNARQAMGDRGKVLVRAQNVRLSGNEGLNLPEGPYVLIEIEDQGPGIPREILPHIFEPFFTTREGGTGLGLFTCRRIVEAHGGRIIAESSPGKGALFRIYLPARPEAGESEPVRSENQKRPLPPARILVMDDEEGVRETLAELLRLHGFEVETAREGQEALERFRQAQEAGRPFDLVILDLTVPGGLGGREILPRLRELAPEVRAIVASGYSQDPIMENYRDFGFDGALLKPFTARDLLAVLTQVLSPR